ncbi:MAG: hypothetical protein ACK5PS_18060 [Desulfopila sp.]
MKKKRCTQYPSRRGHGGPATLAKLLAVCTLLALASLPVCTGWAAEPVSARYVGVSGDTIRLRLTIGSPAPQNIILEQYLPAGCQLVSASPPTRQARGSNVVKWLFKGISPGTIEVVMRVNPPEAAKRVNGSLRYRLKDSGKMKEIRIH